MKTVINLDVMFQLEPDDEEAKVVPANRSGAYAKLATVVVHFWAGKVGQLWAAGYRCREDGRLIGNMDQLITVPLPDKDKWVETNSPYLAGLPCES